MKKVVLALAVVFSVAMVSCGNKNAEAADTDTATVVEVAAEEVVDSANGDTTVVAEVAAEEAPVEAAK